MLNCFSLFLMFFRNKVIKRVKNDADVQINHELKWLRPSLNVVCSLAGILSGLV